MIKITWKDEEDYNLMRDFAIVIFSIVIAIFLVKTDILRNVLIATQGSQIIGSFIAGLFFVSIFTTAPATVILGEIAQSSSIFLVAIVGGLGALLGDLIIYNFIKDRLSKSILHLIKKSRTERFLPIFQLKLFRWIICFLGALIVASPLPDEIGLAMMGLSKMKTTIFVPLSFALNAGGILLIGYIAQMIK